MKKLTEKQIIESIDRGECPECGGQLEQVWENNGFQEPDGPSKNECVEIKCFNCLATF